MFIYIYIYIFQMSCVRFVRTKANISFRIWSYIQKKTLDLIIQNTPSTPNYIFISFLVLSSSLLFLFEKCLSFLFVFSLFFYRPPFGGPKVHTLVFIYVCHTSRVQFMVVCIQRHNSHVHRLQELESTTCSWKWWHAKPGHQGAAPLLASTVYIVLCLSFPATCFHFLQKR